MVTLRPGQRVLNIPGIGVQTSRRAIGGAASNGLLASLVAYWPMNEAAGANNALDLHTNGLTLTQAASPGSAAGIVYTGARTYNGSSQYFSRASEALLQFGHVDFTIAAWIYSTSNSGTKAVVMKDNGSSKRDLLLYGYEGAIYLGVLTSAGFKQTGTATISTSTWYLLLAWHDATLSKLYISLNAGTPSEQATGGTINAPTDVAFSIGADIAGATGKWAGRLGPVAMWKSAAGGGGVLTSDQRTLLWNAGAGLAYSEFS